MGLISRVSSRTYRYAVQSETTYFQPYIGKTHTFFTNLEIRNVIFTAFVGSIVIFEGLNMIVGDAMYCEYDPEKYQPESWEGKSKGLSRLLGKYLCVDPNIALKMEAAQLIRTQNRVMMETTVYDVQALQQVEGHGAFLAYDPAVISQTQGIGLQDYIDRHEIPYKEFNMDRVRKEGTNMTVPARE